MIKVLFNVLSVSFAIIDLYFEAPLIRFEQMKKDFDDSWETETMITTFDMDELETEIEVDHWVCFIIPRTRYKFWTRRDFSKSLFSLKQTHSKPSHSKENFDINLADLDDLGLNNDDEKQEIKIPKERFYCQRITD